MQKGGQYLTDGVCSCACIPDQCNNTLEYDGFQHWWIILIVVIVCCCWMQHQKEKGKRQQAAAHQAVAVQITATVRRPVIGDGGTVRTDAYISPLFFSHLS